MYHVPASALTHRAAVTQHHLDELMPRVPPVPGLRCADHVTFVAADEVAFRECCGSRGLRALDPIITERYPARHIAFSESPGQTQACEEMVGLSVSSDPASPINRLIELYGGHHVDERGDLAVGLLQHVAHAVDDDHEIGDIRAALVRQGVRFMTPTLTFTDHRTGAYLQQMFVACKLPYGPFVEIIKRGPGRGGEPFQGFNADQIDILYEYYDNYSRALYGGTVCP